MLFSNNSFLKVGKMVLEMQNFTVTEVRDGDLNLVMSLSADLSTSRTWISTVPSLRARSGSRMPMFYALWIL